MSRYEEPAPWDDGEYGTGRTQPPKSHSGLIAVLLIAVILLTGTITLLGFMNIRMFQEMNRQGNAQDVSICFDSGAAAETTAVSGGLMQIDANQTLASTSPEAVFPPLATEAAGLTLQEIYVKCIPSVVSITAQGLGGASTGTGVVLSGKGYLVTNFHVVEGAQNLRVRLSDDREFAAALVGSDPVSDLAVLYIDAEGLTEAQFGDSDSLRVGDSVVAIGDPLGVELRGTMTDGIVSAINRGVTVNGRSMNLIQTNAALNSGNSGGPLINSFGQVVGINTMKIGTFTDKSGVEGLGFAIPSATVKEIVNQIIQKGYVSGRPWLGLTGEGFSPFYQRFYRVPTGLYITQVDPGSPAEAVGVMPGDILVTMDGAGIASMEDLNAALYAHQVGDRMILSVYRNGLQADVEVTLTENKG